MRLGPALRRVALCAVYLLSMLSAALAAPSPGSGYGDLKPDQVVQGFRAVAVYLNDIDRPIGGRFIHVKSGFTLDLLEIQSVPQAFMWVTTYPTSDMGEPHTQEHLLLGKGNKGRAVATLEPMALTYSTAFTMQWRTCYSFYTTAGTPVFFDQVERRLDALLHPDYTDEEIRREVRNFGVAEVPGEDRLRLEEKGTVYNEMVSSMDQPGARLYRTANAMVYGDEHPLGFNSGGSPEALRNLTPADIRRFHRQNYRLANMGMIASLPKGVAMTDALARFNALLARVEPKRPAGRVLTELDLPAPVAAAGTPLRIVDYPQKNEQQPGPALLVWPADRTLDRTEQTLLELFLRNVAGDPTTNLYKRLIDSKTREADFGVKSVYARVDEDPGHPVAIGFGDLPPARMNDADLTRLRSVVLDELGRIAALPDGSAELAQFNERMKSRLVEERRALSKFVNSPPAFGFRGSGSEWIEHVTALAKTSGFRKSLTLKTELATIEKLLQEPRNAWRERLALWKLTGTAPMLLAARPSPDLIVRSDAERNRRLAVEVERLKKTYGVGDDQAAIRRYRADYDAASAAMESATARMPARKFVERPPLTLDPELDFKPTRVGPDVPMVATTFDSMTSATAGIALRLDPVAADLRPYLAVFPALLTRVGVIDQGRPVSYEEMSERMKKEILSLDARFSTNAATERAELVVRGAGNDSAEAKRALGWMALALFHPDWREENLPRIRDLVEQALAASRRTMQRPEEYWVQGPAAAYWKQSNPLLMTIESFMTQTHDLLRLSWMLKDVTAEEREKVAQFLHELGEVQSSRGPYRSLIAELSTTDGPGSARVVRMTTRMRQLASDAAKDLDVALQDMPDASVAADWRYLCRRLAADLRRTPQAVLADLDRLRRALLHAGNARMFVVGATTTQEAMAGGIAALADGLDRTPAPAATRAGAPIVRGRLVDRDPSATAPLFVGLVNPNSQSGVFVNSAPLAGYADTNPEKLLDYLATNLYAGRGAHGVFMKTWAAGLAYSNGIRTSPSSGRLGYYAERTPELPQTLAFVINQLKSAGPPDAALVEYAMAESFAATRAAGQFEERAEAIANDLADGQPPDVVARFRGGLLALRTRGDLAEELGRRIQPAYAKVLPGMLQPPPATSDAVYFVIGNDKQLAAWQQYLRTAVGPDAVLHRLYPRDFWIVARPESPSPTAGPKSP